MKDFAFNDATFLGPFCDASFVCLLRRACLNDFAGRCSDDVVTLEKRVVRNLSRVIPIRCPIFEAPGLSLN